MRSTLDPVDTVKHIVFPNMVDLIQLAGPQRRKGLRGNPSYLAAFDLVYQFGFSVFVPSDLN